VIDVISMAGAGTGWRVEWIISRHAGHGQEQENKWHFKRNTFLL